MEAVFFTSFTAIVLLEIFEPDTGRLPHEVPRDAPIST
jgi:hypothetical protein